MAFLTGDVKGRGVIHHSRLDASPARLRRLVTEKQLSREVVVVPTGTAQWGSLLPVSSIDTRFVLKQEFHDGIMAIQTGNVQRRAVIL